MRHRPRVFPFSPLFFPGLFSIFSPALFSVLFFISVCGCAGNAAAPIEDRSRPGTARSEQRYTVLRGDTLFSIAFRHALDYRRLAAANAIGAPYTIFPGQRLILREAKWAGPGATANPPVPGAVAPSPSAPARPAPSAPARPASGASAAASAGWQWPAAGRVIRRFDGKRNKGIDIGGRRGDAVRATRAGRVVYAGSAIAGYGLMLILRHSETYLSAYGHSDALLVGEGDTVRAGQPVARLGSSGTDSVKLHFEIRRHGRPVDPLSVLPSR